MYRAPANTFIDADAATGGGSCGALSLRLPSAACCLAFPGVGETAAVCPCHGLLCMPSKPGQLLPALPALPRPAEHFEHDSIDIGPPPDKEGEQESALNQAQASLLDMSDGDGSATPLGAAGTPSAAGDSSSGGALADLMSLGGGGSSVAGPPVPTLPAASVAAPASGADLLDDLLGGGARPSPAAAAAAPPPALLAAQPATLSGFDDLLGGLGGGSAAPAPPPAQPPAAGVSLVAQPQITPQEFQHKWQAWTPFARTFQQPLTASAVAAVEANGYRVRATEGGGGMCGHACACAW